MWWAILRDIGIVISIIGLILLSLIWLIFKHEETYFHKQSRKTKLSKDEQEFRQNFPF
jgi:hypothetical protein